MNPTNQSTDLQLVIDNIFSCFCWKDERLELALQIARDLSKRNGLHHPFGYQDSERLIRWDW